MSKLSLSTNCLSLRCGALVILALAACGATAAAQTKRPIVDPKIERQGRIRWRATDVDRSGLEREFREHFPHYRDFNADPIAFDATRLLDDRRLLENVGAREVRDPATIQAAQRALSELLGVDLEPDGVAGS